MHACVRVQCVLIMACFVGIEGEVRCVGVCVCVRACVRACSMCAYYGVFCRH